MDGEQNGQGPGPRDWTWERLVQVEPRLGRLLDEAKLRRRGGWPAYEVIKKKLRLLVGVGAARSELASSTAWETAIRVITRAMGL
ncbi:MAG TPA: hypothetical protein VG826_34990 [Pirellulales bacterium]|nr:hypothetical protein [Pirellulales bacterium]